MRWRSLVAACFVQWALCVCPGAATAQASATPTGPAAAEPAKAPQVVPRNTSPPASKVDVAPIARDDEIQARLAKILNVAGFFENPHVEVKDGVVFLSGRTAIEANKQWATKLAENTQDVVAVVNHIQIAKASVWDFSPAIETFGQMEVGLVRSLPLAACGFVILVVAYAAAVLVTRWMRKALNRRIYAPLLREVLARCVGFLVMVLGAYVTLRIANLTHLALTVVGGTGLLGLILGIAFGNITENFLASILLSMQQPFHIGDLVQVEGILGYVQRLTTRTTIMATVDGNEVQIPNATIYKSIIRNFSTVPNCRIDFTICVPRADVDTAQARAADVLARHQAVLSDPEPTVLVDSINDSSVSLRAYFWINGRQTSMLKVRSSVMRMVLQSVDSPQHRADAADGTGRRGRGTPKGRSDRSRNAQGGSHKAESETNSGEGTLATDATEIQGQMRAARHGNGENLLRPDPNGKSETPPGNSR